MEFTTPLGVGLGLAIRINSIVNLIMNEYANYGKGHTIHSSGQIEWHTNTVDDKSVQVGGQ